MTNILVLNSGSTSIKYTLFDCELKTIQSGEKTNVVNYVTSLNEVLSELNYTFDIIGYRIVHGGSEFNKPTIITDEVISKLENINQLAPLHNIPACNCVNYMRHKFPQLKHIAVFDTAFHSTIPDYSYRYAVPEKWYSDYGIRKYGFHGISCSYLTNTIGVDYPNIIICHLGGGSSVTTVKHGQSIHTTMEFSPLSGIPGMTRSGNIDPTVIKHLVDYHSLSTYEIFNDLNRNSGMFGLCGKSHMRDISESNDDACTLARDLYIENVRSAIGSAYARLDCNVDVIVFSGGIGVYGKDIVESIMCGLEQLSEFVIVIKTNEELEIATQVLGIS